MERDAFWQLINTVRTEARNDETQFESILIPHLEKLELTDLVEFDYHLRELVAQAYLNQLWGAAYIINGGASGDGFYYFRSWLVMQGKEVYEKALTDPDSLVEVCDQINSDAEAEEVLYAAVNVYREKTDEDFESMIDPGDIGEVWPTDPDWKEEDLPQLFPRLSARYKDD
ncbi:MAG: DUF4240 domain-containing protein [Acidobacteria bacterium]|nr:DUF4240 domain-containing protein [Acidobacteriota bacterium]